MALDKLKAMSEAYVKNIDSDINNIVSDNSAVDNIAPDKRETILNELIKKNADIFSLHQENTLKTGLLVTDIVKGVQSGEDIYYLFLKAVECIGLTTGDTALPPVCKKNLEIVYGYGGVSNSPLEMKLQDTEQRLYNLIQAKQIESDSDVIKRIENSIKTHETQISNLRRRINRL